MGLGDRPQDGRRDHEGLVRTMTAYDAGLVEIDPLAIVSEPGAKPGDAPVRRLVCLDAKVTLDDSALSRHPGTRRPARPRRGSTGGREAREAGLTFIKLDGSVGCMVNGAGLAMTTMDASSVRVASQRTSWTSAAARARQGRPCDAADHVRRGRRDPRQHLRRIARGDEVARGLIEARAQQTRDVPMVVRVVGTNAAEAAALLEEAHFQTAASLDEAAAKAVAAARGAEAPA